jgi:rubrerythrin
MGDNNDKPSYLGLLNAIAVGESRGQQLLEAWAQKTSAAELKQLLAMVAIRAQEHAASFTKRLCELGYAVRPAPAGDFEARLSMMRSDASDRVKFDCVFDFGKPMLGSDTLATIFRDESIDIETGALLGRFIAEERDSERRLRACYEQLREAPQDATLNEICARLERLTRSIEELKAIRGR